MTLKRVKEAMESIYRLSSNIAREKYGKDFEKWLDMEIRMREQFDGIVTACIYCSNGQTWRKAQEYGFALVDRFGEDAESACK